MQQRTVKARDKKNSQKDGQLHLEKEVAALMANYPMLDLAN